MSVAAAFPSVRGFVSLESPRLDFSRRTLVSTIDRIMIIVTVASVVWWLISRRRRPKALAALSVGALVMAVATVALEGVVWQLVPWQFLAVAVTGAAALRHWRP